MRGDAVVAQGSGDARIGDVVGPVVVGPVAHGGHCVARLDGRVIFVRHTLPGEEVLVRLTDVAKPTLWRGDAVEIVAASPSRVRPRCSVAGSGLCGGCDWQHASSAAQRELKRVVVAEQMKRLAGIDWKGTVEAPPGDGYRWRTRMRYLADGGRVGMRAHRSHHIIELPDEGCAISASRLPEPPLDFSGEMVVAGTGTEVSIVAEGEVVLGPAVRTEHAAGRSYAVAADGFWQVHPAAAEVLAAAVITGLEPRPGERALDLYCGVGLFAGALADQGVSVLGVESWGTAVDCARTNVPEATFAVAKVDCFLARHRARTDLVVLDPPRTGAGRDVVAAVAKLQPRAVAYVACDPAALARDVATFAQHGYRVRSLRAFDLFPQTHHVESVCLLSPSNSEAPSRVDDTEMPATDAPTNEGRGTGVSDRTVQRDHSDAADCPSDQREDR